jgi:hypothetical protein
MVVDVLVQIFEFAAVERSGDRFASGCTVT